MPLLIGNPAVDEVIEYPRMEFRGWGGGWRMWKWLRTAMTGLQPDLAMDFQGLLRSALIGRASDARLFAGLSDAREGAGWFYQRTVTPPSQPVHAVERYLALADAMLNLYPSARILPDGEVCFPLPEGQPPDAANYLAEGYILVHPYARGRAKSLNNEELSGLLREIRNKQIVLVGRADCTVLDRSTDCLNLLNLTTLDQLIWLTRRASFVVSVDSGPAHLAAALGRPMVAIHSWSDPRRVGPYRADAWVWKNGTLTQVRRLSEMKAEFFDPNPLRLQAADLEALARLATSPSDFSA